MEQDRPSVLDLRRSARVWQRVAPGMEPFPTADGTAVPAMAPQTTAAEPAAPAQVSAGQETVPAQASASGGEASPACTLPPPTCPAPSWTPAVWAPPRPTCWRSSPALWTNA